MYISIWCNAQVDLFIPQQGAVIEYLENIFLDRIANRI